MLNENINLVWDKEYYGCAICNKKNRIFALYDYYDTKFAPYCNVCFLARMKEIIKNYNIVVEKLGDKGVV